jgi:hypothetical protein
VKSAQQQLELKGIAATADDFAEVKRPEQQVTIAEARGKWAPLGEVDELTALRRETQLLRAKVELERLRGDD